MLVSVSLLVAADRDEEKVVEEVEQELLYRCCYCRRLSCCNRLCSSQSMTVASSFRIIDDVAVSSTVAAVDPDDEEEEVEPCRCPCGCRLQASFGRIIIPIPSLLVCI